MLRLVEIRREVDYWFCDHWTRTRGVSAGGLLVLRLLN